MSEFRIEVWILPLTGSKYKQKKPHWHALRIINTYSRAAEEESPLPIGTLEIITASNDKLGGKSER